MGSSMLRLCWFVIVHEALTADYRKNLLTFQIVSSCSFTAATKWNTTAMKMPLLFEAGLFIWFWVEKGFVARVKLKMQAFTAGYKKFKVFDLTYSLSRSAIFTLLTLFYSSVHLLDRVETPQYFWLLSWIFCYCCPCFIEVLFMFLLSVIILKALWSFFFFSFADCVRIKRE